MNLATTRLSDANSRQLRTYLLPRPRTCFYVRDMPSLLTDFELDDLLHYPSGRSRRLALKGLIPFIRLPDGEIRFDRDAIDALLTQGKVEVRAPESIAEVPAHVG